MVDSGRKGIRTCTACGKKAPKQELYRIVREADGSSYDSKGTVSGRGAYVCSLACLETALKTKKLARALRTSLAPEVAEQIASNVAAATHGSQR